MCFSYTIPSQHSAPSHRLTRPHATSRDLTAFIIHTTSPRQPHDNLTTISRQPQVHERATITLSCSESEADDVKRVLFDGSPAAHTPVSGALRSQLEVMKEGRIFVKFGKGKPKSKLLYFEEGALRWCAPGQRAARPEHCISIKDIKHILVGKRASTFRGEPRFRCFTIVSEQGSLELEAESLYQRKAWINGILALTDSEAGTVKVITQAFPGFHEKKAVRSKLPSAQEEKRQVPVFIKCR